jgi:hypothetical protein
MPTTTTTYTVMDSDTNEEIGITPSDAVIRASLESSQPEGHVRVVIGTDAAGEPLLVLAPDCQGHSTTLRVYVVAETTGNEPGRTPAPAIRR